MVKWAVVLSFLMGGHVQNATDVVAYQTRIACEKMKPIRLMHVLDLFAKYHVKLLSVDCMPIEGE